MAYGTIKIDTITFTDGGIDKSVAISGLVQNPTFTGNVTVTGTISGNTVRGQTVSGVTVTGTTAQFTSGTFVSLTGTTLQGTTATYTTGSFTSLTGTTTSGTTANFVSGVFSTQISGVTVTGTTANFTSGNFINISGGTHTITSGVFAAGTAANPSISFTSDPNTGIYSPGADQVAISTNGTGRLFVDSSGNVGIGASPAVQLDVATADDTQARLRATTNGVDVRINSLGLTGNAGQIGTWSNHPFVFRTNNTERMRLDSSGRLGLGTSSPSSLLELSSDLPTLRLRDTTDTSYAEILNNNGTLSLRADEGSSGTTSFIDFRIDGSERARITSAGNVGIGTTSPGATLDVRGNASIGTQDANAVTLELGGGATGDRAVFIDLVGDTTYTDYGARLVRTSGGANGNTNLLHRGTGNLNISAIEAGALTLNTSNIERARIDSSGRLLVGTSSAISSSLLDSAYLQVAGTNNENSQLLIARFSNDVDKPRLTFAKSRGSLGTNTIVQSGDVLGEVLFTGAAGNASNAYPIAAWIRTEVDGTPGTNDMPGRLVFSTTADGASSPTERMRITSAGNVGVGTASPATLLQAAQSSAGTVATFNYTSSTGGGSEIRVSNGYSSTAPIYSFWFNNTTGIGNPAANAISAIIAGTERARIDSSGRLLVGTSSAYGTGNLQVSGSSNTGTYTNNAFSSNHVFIKSRSTTSGGFTVVQSDDELGGIVFQGTDGSANVSGARIFAAVDGTPGTNDMPGRLVFSTTADGASSPTERMRIQQNGTVLIGTTSAISSGSGTTDGVQIEPTALVISRDAQPVGYFRRRSSDGQMFQFFRDTTQVGNISVTTTATAYNTSSDYRLKENVVPLTGAADRLNQLQVHRFNFIADPGKTVDGFIAHEAQAVVPECVTGTKDEVDDEGNPVYQGIDQSKMVPLAVAAIQECIKRIEALETELALLKNGN